MFHGTRGVDMVDRSQLRSTGGIGFLKQSSLLNDGLERKYLWRLVELA